MNDDVELLRQYARDRSEKAFAELVQRHLNLVYGAALRMVGGDAHRAQDVAQSVFTDLARKAAVLSGHSSLAGWLHTSARYAAAKAIRAEQRRQKHEGEAQIMNQLLHPSASEGDWDRLRPVLDEVMGGLSSRDREAILLRFFEKRSFNDIGLSLRTTEDAARMRVERALEKMRVRLARRGIDSTTAALSAMLTGPAVSAAPAGLAAVVTKAALSGAGGGAVLFLSNLVQSKSTIAAGIVAAVGVTLAVLQQRSDAGLGDEIASLRQENQQAESSRTDQTRRIEAALAENETLRAQLAQLQMARTHSQTRRPDSTSKPAAISPAADPASAEVTFIPTKDLKNVGRATPRLAYETALWAETTGDTDTLAGMLKLGPQALTKVQAYLAGLPQDMQAQYGTPEKFVALMLASDAANISGVQILGQTARTSDDVVLYRATQLQGGGENLNAIELSQGVDGWQRMIRLGLVNSIINNLTGQTKKP